MGNEATVPIQASLTCWRCHSSSCACANWSIYRLCYCENSHITYIQYVSPVEFNCTFTQSKLSDLLLCWQPCSILWL